MEHIIADEREEIYTKCMWSALLIRAQSSKTIYETQYGRFTTLKHKMLRLSKMDPERMDTNKPKSEDLYYIVAGKTRRCCKQQSFQQYTEVEWLCQPWTFCSMHIFFYFRGTFCKCAKQ